MTADVAAYRAIRGLAREPLVTPSRRLSRIGQHGAVWLALGAAGALVDRRRRAAWLAGARRVAFSYVLNTAIKLAIGRRRPDLADLPPLMGTPTALAFPSSHAVTSFCGARIYGRLVPRAPLYALACALCFSRVYLGVHYPSDVLAGAALGTALA